MIRLNPASSNTATKRRSNNNGNSSSNSRRNKESTTNRHVDNTMAGLVGDGNDEGTHNDIYTEGTSSKVNKLFEELLGDNASALGSVTKSKGGEESTAMSSVLGPILRANAAKNGNNLANIPEDNGRDDPQDAPIPVLNINSNNNPTLNQLSKHRKKHQSQQQNQEELTIGDEDTYMTKPREINFDPNDDDISALYGGHGGASMSGHGVESYMGTFAAQRKNARAARNDRDRGGGGGMFGIPKSNKGRRIPEEDSRGTSTFQSHGVNSILEEIGLRPSKNDKKLRRSFTEEEEENKGHHVNKSRSRNAARDGDRGRDRGGGRHESSKGKKHREPEGFFRNMRTKHWAVIIVGVMFVAIQFTTVHKRDRATMKHITSRFQNHRYATASDQNAQLMQSIANENVETGDQGNQRRRGNYAEEGIGDVLRKTVPLQHKREWEQDEIMMDDGIGNLRGNNKNAVELERQVQQRQREQRAELEQVRRQVQQQQQQPQGNKMMANSDIQQQHQQQPQPQGNKMMSSDNNNLQPQQEMGDTHPLLKPQTGLSMTDALTKLSGDKLSDIDPIRPQQQLSNDIIPKRFAVFADLKTPYLPGRDTPYFWHIPRSGGVVMKTLLSHCLGQTLAAEVGELDGHANDSELKVISFSEHNYTNVNIATPEGISRALNRGLVPGHLAQTLVSAHVDLIPSLFNANDRARAFVLVRHPVDRAASMFYFLKGTGYPPLKNMTVDDYAKSELIENNWLVRILSESMTGPIDMDNLEIAKEVLRRKFIIGLLDNKRGSFARFDHYFKWKESPNYEKQFGCRKQLMDEKYTPKHPIRKDTDTWKLLLEQNRFDVHLYDFAKELFSQQSYIFGL